MRSLVSAIGSLQVEDFLRRYSVKQKELAEMLGVNPKTITRWKEEGTPEAGARHLAAIAAHFDNQLHTPQLIRNAIAFIRHNQGVSSGVIRGRLYSAYEYALAKHRSQQ